MWVSEAHSQASLDSGADDIIIMDGSGTIVDHSPPAHAPDPGKAIGA